MGRGGSGEVDEDAEGEGVMKQRRHRPLPPTQVILDEIKFLWSYDEVNGGFTWTRRRIHNQPRMGRKVGGPDGRGYNMCLVFGHKFKVHQLVWLWHTGQLPTMFIDHINGVRDDNRIENLREATPSQNLHNQKALLSVDRGFKVCGKTGKFRANITLNNKKIDLGGYLTKEEAHEAYMNAKARLVKDFSPANLGG